MHEIGSLWSKTKTEFNSFTLESSIFTMELPVWSYSSVCRRQRFLRGCSSTEMNWFRKHDLFINICSFHLKWEVFHFYQIGDIWLLINLFQGRNAEKKSCVRRVLVISVNNHLERDQTQQQKKLAWKKTKTEPGFFHLRASSKCRDLCFSQWTVLATKTEKSQEWELHVPGNCHNREAPAVFFSGAQGAKPPVQSDLLPTATETWRS